MPPGNGKRPEQPLLESLSGYILTENRNALIVESLITEANGRAECDAVIEMADRNKSKHGKALITLGADKGYASSDSLIALCGINRSRSLYAVRQFRVGILYFLDLRQKNEVFVKCSGNGAESTITKWAFPTCPLAHRWYRCGKGD